MTNAALLFVDTETLGLDMDAPIWDLAAIRVNALTERRIDLRIMHKADPERLAALPPAFQDDYDSRYSVGSSVHPQQAMYALSALITPGTIVCGSNPSFDMARLERLAGKHNISLPWHYHPIDVPTMAHGWLCGKGIYPTPPWKSDLLSQFCGVNPKEFGRHTAMGDARWCLALWRKITEEKS